jgi:hypothetical protein
MIQVTRFNIQDSKEINIDGVKVTYFRYNKFFEFLGDTGWQFSPRLIKTFSYNFRT